MPRRFTYSLLALLLALSAPFVRAQNTSPETNASVTSPAKPANGIGFKDRYPRYQIVAGDTMELVFEFSPEFNQTITVQPDGFVSLRGIGDVHVSSQTVPQVTNTLQTAYTKILNNPAISVVLKDFDKPFFTAMGQLGHPGRFDLHGDTTVTEAVAMAGGFTEKAKHSHVLLFRKVSSQWTEARVLDVKKMMKSGNLSEDFVLQPGDMIFVPQNNISKMSRFIPTSSLSTYIAPQTF